MSLLYETKCNIIYIEMLIVVITKLRSGWILRRWFHYTGAIIIAFYNYSMWLKMCYEEKLGAILLLWL